MRIVLPLSVLVAALSGCGGGGASPGQAVVVGTADLHEVEIRHANGQLAEKGTVIDDNGTSLRHGQWRTWFENGQQRWSGTYHHHVIAADQPWREWNVDGSVRDDSGDG